MDAADDAEFSDFMHGRWAQLVRLGYGLTGDVQIAEDLAQTAFARAYASWPRVCRAADPDAYVRKIVVNANLNRYRRRRVTEDLTAAVPEVERRRAFAAAGVAAVVVLGVLVPRLVSLAGQPGPVTPRYNVTVHQPAPGSPSGQVAWGTINGKRWQVRVVAMRGLSNGCTIIGQDLECVPEEASASPGQVSFVDARSGGTQFQLAAVGAGVTKVTVTLGNGTELTLRPTAVDGKDWVAFAAPTRLPVIRAVSFAGTRELGYAIPYNGASGAQFVAWLRPGQRGTARAAYRIGSGTLGGKHWSSWAYVGPWGACVEGVGGASWCAPSPADIRPDNSPTSYFTCSPGGQGVWFAAAAQPSVVRVRFGLSDGRSLSVAAVRIAGGGRAYAFAVPNGVRLQIWDAYNAAGKIVGVGPGWKCG